VAHDPGFAFGAYFSFHNIIASRLFFLLFDFFNKKSPNYFTKTIIGNSLGIQELPVMYLNLIDKQAGELWIIQNQLGKRNLSPRKKKYLIGLEYSLKKNDHGGKRESSMENPHLTTTAKRLGDFYKLNESTIRQYEKEYHVIKHFPEDLRNEFLSHKNQLINSKKITLLSKAALLDDQIICMLKEGDIESAIGLAESLLEEPERKINYEYGFDPEIIADNLIDTYPQNLLKEVINQLIIRIPLNKYQIKLPWGEN